MDADEAAIRSLISTWMDATRAGDTATVLGLMTDDAVFLTPGQPPMDKAHFAAAAQSQADSAVRPEIDARSEIQEIRVLGDWAWMWTRLTVTVRVPGAPERRRAGHTLSILRKVNGRWQLARDANMLAPVGA
jgi:uncharacterized protein (TIGR02246 family)